MKIPGSAWKIQSVLDLKIIRGSKKSGWPIQLMSNELMSKIIRKPARTVYFSSSRSGFKSM
jgi:hypothetical protein